MVIPGLLPAPDALLGWLVELAGAGMTAAGIEHKGVGRAAAASDFAGALDRLVNRLAGVAVSVAEALDGRYGVDPQRWGLVGISVGGWAALRAAERYDGREMASGPRAVAALLCGPGWRRVPARARAFFRPLGLDLPETAVDMAVDPDRYPHLHPGDAGARGRRLAGRAVLLAAGGKDPLVPLQDVRALYEAIDRQRPQGDGPERHQLLVYPGLGHEVSLPMRRRVVSWVGWMLGA
ncbi:MAG: hypothetical protein IMX02_09160 [Limnochordaceae bacterium]|nr:hypothetical protein [Limnochordaceae bacterium]